MRRFLYVWLGSLSLLLIPLIAMRFTEEVNWDAMDFLIMGALLSVCTFLFYGSNRVIKKKPVRWVFSIIILLLFFALWAELAVGILGSPVAGS